MNFARSVRKRYRGKRVCRCAIRLGLRGQGTTSALDEFVELTSNTVVEASMQRENLKVQCQWRAEEEAGDADYEQQHRDEVADGIGGASAAESDNRGGE